MKRLTAGLLAVLGLCACDRSAPEAPENNARPEPVVVYASYEDENYLPSLFSDFTRESGIPVSVRHRPEQQIVSEVIEKRDSPPADVLLTRSVQGAWRAAAEGALRPLQSETVTGLVPAWLRDPDGYWTATGFDTIEVVCRADAERDCGAVGTFEQLSEPEFEGRLCLSTSSLGINRVLIAGLIADHGSRSAEILVRGWIANLALPPFETEQALLQAVEAGGCPLAVASGIAIREFGKAAVAATWPRPGYVNVVAVGVGRHARSPDAARTLVEWLVSRDAQAAQSAAIGLHPVNPGLPAGSSAIPATAAKRNAGLGGIHETEAVQLAERARWD